MYCTPLTSATAVFASTGPMQALIVAPELNDALQSLAAQPVGAHGRQEKLDRLQAVLRDHSDRISASDKYCKQLVADDPVQVAAALHRLAFDFDALLTLRKSEGFELPKELRSEIPELDEATRQELQTGLARAASSENPERLLNKSWFRMATNLGSGLFYMVPCLLEWAVQEVQAKAEGSNGLSRMLASAARFVEKGATSVQGYMGDDELIAAAKQGPLGLDQVETYLKRRSFPIHLGPSLQQMAPEKNDVLDMIRQALPGRVGTPYKSSMASTGGAYHFAINGKMLTRAMAETKDPKLYARLAQLLSMEVLQQLRIQLQVLHGERIQKLKAAVDSGKSVILVCNHRSHLDTLILLLLFEFLQPGFVAKKSLLKVPLLGRMITQGGHETIDPDGGTKALVAVRDFTLKMFGEQRAVAFFPEGTRYPGLQAGIESGLQPFKSGVFWGAQHAIKQGFEVLIQPVFFYGDGLILPKGTVEGVGGKEASVFSAFMDGILRGQSVVARILEPLDVNELSRIVGTGSELATELGRQTHYQMWQAGAPLQAAMNRRKVA